MINRIKQLLSGESADNTPEARADEVQLATAALLVESAFMDGNFDEDEMQSIQRLLTDRFNLNEEELETLVFEAEQAVAASGQLYRFTRVIKDRFDEEQRIGMIEMLWEVAFADGDADHFEQNLIQRVAGLIFVSDRDRGDAKKRVMARLGIS
jgi:uncharacterized tellurite resistance protein B-like protein